MNFFKRLFGPSQKPEGYSYWVTVQCNRCGEILRGRVDMRNDLSTNYDDQTYFTRKVIMGENRCFQQIEVTLTFDQNRKLLKREIQGGKFVDEG